MSHLTPLFRDVQKEQGILQERVSVLELKCSELQTSNRDLMEDSEREKLSVRSAEAVLQQQQLVEEKNRVAFESAVREANLLAEERGGKVNDLTVENEKLRQEVAAAKAVIQSPPSPPKCAIEDSSVVAALKADMIRLQSEKEELVRKSKTIEERYKNSHLVCSPLPPRRAG